MAESELVGVIGRVVERFIALLSEDKELHGRLRALAKEVLARTEEPGALETKVEAAPPVIEVKPVVRAEPQVQMTREVLAKMLQGEGRPGGYAAAGPSIPDVTDADLPLIESRCRMKSEGARWAAKRRRLIADGADYQIEIQPDDRDIIDRARKVPDCLLWTNISHFTVPSDPALMEDLAGCFDTAAEAVSLMRLLMDSSKAGGGDFETALNLLAEAQSALRGAVNDVDHKQDRDQLRLYMWLRGACWKNEVFIHRYMRIDDTADPRAWGDLVERIGALSDRLRAARQRGKQHESSLKRIRHHLKPLTTSNGDNHEHDWRVVIDTVEAMVGDGVQPSNAELRDLLLPVLDRVPETELPPGFARVLREIDRYRSTRPAAEAEQEAPVFAPTAEVKAVADMLRGRTLVLIGGVRRPQSHAALKEAFELQEVDWIETREHESVSTFEPHIARPEAAVVVLAIRWSSHSYGDVKDFCDRYGKPLVRLPAGYNPNQVASNILKQCGQRLSEVNV